MTILICYSCLMQDKVDDKFLGALSVLQDIVSYVLEKLHKRAKIRKELTSELEKLCHAVLYS